MKEFAIGFTLAGFQMPVIEVEASWPETQSEVHVFENLRT